MTQFAMPGDLNESPTSQSKVSIVDSALGDTKYSKLSPSKLNRLVNKHQDAGFETVLKDEILPKIVVIDNQSAAKSSLIEAISKIKLHRAEGS